MRTYNADEWQSVREAGKGAFLLKHGFLGRGLPLGLVMGVALEGLVGSGDFQAAVQGFEFWGRTLFAVAVFTASGCISSLANWSVHERRHAGAGDSAAR